MGRIYTVPFTGTITAAGGDVDLLSIQPADDKPIKLCGFRLAQITEVGDTAEEGLRVTIRRMTATVTIGSGGAAVTAATPPHDAAEPVWGFTARANDTTVATTTGTSQILEEIGWSNRNSPYDWFPPVPSDDRFLPKARQGEVLIVRLETTLADDMTGVFTFYVEED